MVTLSQKGELSAFLWFLLFLSVIITFTFPFLSIPTGIYALVVVLLGTVFAFIHGSARYGVKGILVFIGLCLIISNILENISILTGFPFGHYYYTDLLGLKLFAVPILIGPAYVSTGYLSFVIGNVLLDMVDDRLHRFAIFALPFIASFIMVMWDLVMDPTSSTVSKLWIWQGGGGFFGVPLSNYLGWFLTVYIFFQAFAFYIAKMHRSVRPVISKGYWYQAILFYLVIGLGFFVNFLAAASDNSVVTDATGMIWSKHAIGESAVIVSLYTMCFVSVLALIRIYNQSKTRE